MDIVETIDTICERDMIFDESSFIQTVPTNLICSICMNVAKDADAWNCPHAVCRQCAETLYKRERERQVCPSCNAQLPCLKELKPNYTVNLAIANMEVQCPNTAAGCNAKMTLGEKGANVVRHLQVDCQFRRWRCADCTALVPAAETKEQHQPTCPYRKVVCTQCEKEIPYEVMHKHTSNEWKCMSFTHCPHRRLHEEVWEQTEMDKTRKRHRRSSSSSSSSSSENIEVEAEIGRVLEEFDSSTDTFTAISAPSSSSPSSSSSSSSSSSTTTTTFPTRPPFRIRISDLSRHLEHCPYEPIRCTVPACKQKLVRRDLHQHWKDNLEVHGDMMIKTIDTLGQAQETLKRTVNDLKARLTVLEMHVGRGRQNNQQRTEMTLNSIRSDGGFRQV